MEIEDDDEYEEEEEEEEEEEDYTSRFEEWEGPGGWIRRERCSEMDLAVLNTEVPLGSVSPFPLSLPTPLLPCLLSSTSA